MSSAIIAGLLIILCIALMVLMRTSTPVVASTPDSLSSISTAASTQSVVSVPAAVQAAETQVVATQIATKAAETQAVATQIATKAAETQAAATQVATQAAETQAAATQVATQAAETQAAATQVATQAVEYTFFQGKDSPGDDITHLKDLEDKVNELKSWCNENKDCKGFNTTGWMKSKVAPPNRMNTWTSDPAKGFYAKVGSVPPPDDYVFYPQKDSPWNDITKLAHLANNVDGLKAWCNSNPNCKGFNTDGWMKHAVTIPDPNDKGVNFREPNRGLYVKQ